MASSTFNFSPDQQQAISDQQMGNALDVFGADVGAASHVMYGITARQAASFQAAQLRINATQAQAASERNAFDVQQNTQFVTSRALAVAAASGGGASDPTVVNLIARDKARGAYLQATALYQGDERARMMNMEAAAKEYEGKETERNSMMVGAAQAARGGANSLFGDAKMASLYQRFGGGGPMSFGGMATDSGYAAGIEGGAQ